MDPDEPRPAEGIPDMPEWLDDEAQAEWQRIVAAVGGIRLLTMADGTTLAAYCQARSDYIGALEEVRREGITIETARGRTKNPAVTVMNEARRAMQQLGNDIGLSPSSRTRIKTPRPEPNKSADPKAKFA